MAYSTYDDVRRVINTSLEDSYITEIIAWSDAEIDKQLGSQSSSDELIEKLSVLLTARTIKTRQPTSMGAGAYRETHDPIPIWTHEIDKIYSLYRSGAKIYGTPYEHIDEDERYTEDVREPED
jgi:hypothetical protein